MSFPLQDKICNATVSCSLHFVADGQCPIPLNLNMTGCFPPCEVEGCRYIYRDEEKCPTWHCVTISKQDYGLIFGLLFAVFMITLLCVCGICYVRCNPLFRRINNLIFCSFHTVIDTVRDIGVEEGTDEDTTASRTTMSGSSSPATRSSPIIRRNANISTSLPVLPTCPEEEEGEEITTDQADEAKEGLLNSSYNPST